VTDKRVVMRIMQMPKEHKDAADLFLNAPNAGEIWERMVREAKPAMSWMIEHLDKRFDLTTPSGKAEAATGMLDMLVHQPPIERGYHVRELAQKLEAHEDDVREHLNDLFLKMPVQAEPVMRRKPIVLDKYGEATGFICPACNYTRTHYSEPMGVWHCWTCDEYRNVQDIASLERLITESVKRHQDSLPKNVMPPSTRLEDVLDLS
jgi:ribosomal protein L37AE/L43A